MNRTNFKEISENPCRLCRYYRIGYFNDISFKCCVFGGIFLCLELLIFLVVRNL